MKTFVLLIILVPFFAAAQVNQTDANGYKQGIWKKYHPNGELRYEGEFKDNQPVGEWKRYHGNGNLQAILNYSDASDSTFSALYDQKGKLIAKGCFISEKKEGLWEFFQENKLISESNFRNGVKHGLEKIYYDSGEVLEEIDWVDAKKNGKYQAYYKSGNPYIQCKYKEDKRDGFCLVYFPNGDIELEAFYENDLRHGNWKYFNNKGETDYTLTYEKGILKNPQVLDSVQNENFEELVKNQPNIVDPEKFMQNPDEFLRNLNKR